jgi:hypothetical protein
MSISIESLKEAIKIKEQIADLEAKLAKILNGEAPTPARRGRKPAQAETPGAEAPAAKQPTRVKKARKAKRQMSEEGRNRISEAAKARWASKRNA